MEARKPQAEALLGQLDWVRRLARTLVQDPTAAEDVAQETWLAAHGAAVAAPSRPWLATIARNVVRQRHRSEASRRHRQESYAESNAKREAAEASSEEVVLRTERQRVVVDAVMSLDEPYRSTVLLRFVEGLEPMEIARRQGLPAATVRSHSRRALQELRRKLEAEYGEGERLAVFLLPLTLREAASKGLLAGGVPVAAGTLTLQLLMVFLGIVGTVWWVVSRPSSPPTAVVSVTLDDDPNPASWEPTNLMGGFRESTRRGAPDPANPAAAPPEPIDASGLSGWWLQATIGGAQGRPLELHVQAGSPPRAKVLGALDAHGQTSIDLAPIFEHETLLPEELVVTVDHPEFLPVRRVLPVNRTQRQAGFPGGGGTEFLADWTMQPAEWVLEGQIETPAGVDAEGLLVALLQVGGEREEPVARTKSDAEGRYQLRAPGQGTYVLVVWADTREDQLRLPLPRPAYQTVVVDTSRPFVHVELSTGASISGRLAGAATLVNLPLSVPVKPLEGKDTKLAGLVWKAGRFDYGRFRFPVGLDRTFHITGLAPITYELSDYVQVWRGRSIFSRWGPQEPGPVQLKAPAQGVHLTNHARALMFEVRASGQPLARPAVQEVTAHGHTKTQGGEDGRIVLFYAGEGVLEGQVKSLRFSKPGFSERDVGSQLDDLPLATWNPIELEPQEEGRIVLALQGDPDRTAESFRIWLDDPDEPTTTSVKRFHSCKRLGDELVLKHVRPGRYVMTVEPDAEGADQLANRILTQTFELEVLPGQDTHQNLPLVLGGHIRAEPGAFPGEEFLRVRLLDAGGQPIPVRAVSIGRGGGVSGRSQGLFHDHPCTLLPTLGPGLYTLQVWGDTLAEQSIPIRIEAGRDFVLGE